MAETSIPLTLAQAGATDPAPEAFMPTMIAGFDWAATPLGPIDTWSAIRRRTVQLICRSDIAIATMWGPEGILIYNDACAALLGRHHPGSLGQPAAQANPRMKRFIRDILARVHAGETVVLHDYSLVSDRGDSPEQIWLSLSYTPILDADGRIDGVHAALTETTNQVREREEVETALRQSMKMEAIGQLTGGISHDFNNLLTGILGNLDMLATRIEQGDHASAMSYLDGARSAASRAAGLTQRLLTFARRQALAPAAISVATLLDDLHELIDRTVGPAIEVQTLYPPDLRAGFCDRNQLENALLNLAINARDAMPEGGRLTIEASNATLVAPARGQTHTEGDYVRLTITDTGCGMSDEVKDRVFEPFFTTKPAGQGTGLGLSMVYGFIKQSGGHIELASEAGRGTKISLFIPCNQLSGATETSDAPAPAPDMRWDETSGLILVVDDEPGLRTLLADMLREQGFSVRMAADAEAALAILRAEPDIDLLIADIGLPGAMNGRQLALAARADRPELPLLFVTGLDETTSSGPPFDSAPTAMLRKPFSFGCLHTQVGLLLAHSRTATPPRSMG
ncbi:ATP-binding protein [Acidiphilium multivorum]|uniref:ATP-binding protein n=1 Tax=Acidiphilium multivorum TaxID=62140 RepID=UPI001B8CB650|nr:response regulator [Acidiphilium multivorum]MBU6356517.1 response regulator [Rhodospirillales bacterium]